MDTVPLDDLIAHPDNPKTHDLPLLADSLRRFGFADPVVVDQRTGLLVSGHGRVEALRLIRDAGGKPPSGIGDDWSVPTFTGWSSADDDEAAAALVALNRTTEAGGWDQDALLALLDRIGDDQLTGVGYDPHDVDDLRVALGEMEDVDRLADGWEPDPDPTDFTITLTVSPEVHDRWTAHRRTFDTDGDALGALV